jgi:hypothetical protein
MEEIEALARQEDTTLADVLRKLIDRALHGQRAQAAPAPQQGSAGTAQPAEEQAAHCNMKIHFSVVLTPSLYQALTEAAESLRVARTELVRRAVAAGLEYVKSGAGRLPPCPYELSGEYKIAFTVNLTASLLREVDTLSRLGKTSRSHFIRRSVCYYITSVMKQGGGVGAWA